jgi:hypothetical protein
MDAERTAIGMAATQWQENEWLRAALQWVYEKHGYAHIAECLQQERNMDRDALITSDQIARDMQMGVFPQQSEATRKELAERQRVFEIALRSIQAGAPGVSDAIQRSMALSIARRVVLTAPAPGPCDVPPV